MKNGYIAQRACPLLGASLALLGLISGCDQVEGGPAGQAVAETESTQSELYRLYTAWPQGIVPVCWSAASVSRSDFLVRSATVRKRTAEEWPTAAKISFVGWSPCPSNTAGMVVLNLNDDSNGNGSNGYQGQVTHTVNLGVLRGDFGNGLVPHEFGHVLGFGHEMVRPDFDSTLACDQPDQAGGDYLGTTADFDSIMASTNYCQNNFGLSAQDRSGSAVLYGARPSRFAWSGQWTTLSTSYSTQFADVNGDRRADLISRSGTDLRVALSNGSSFGSSSTWAGWNSAYDYRLADVNRDGKADLIGRNGTDIQVALSTGSGFAGSSSWAWWNTASDLQVADVNGDGRADLIGRAGTDIQVALSTGTGFAGSSLWTTWGSAYDYRLADVNGDGRADLIGRSGADIQVALSTGSGFAPSSSWAWWNTVYDLNAIDVDGDGRADLVGRSGSDIQVALSMGAVFAGSTQWATWSSTTTHLFGDVNGDGRADLLGRYGTAIHVALASN